MRNPPGEIRLYFLNCLENDERLSNPEASDMSMMRISVKARRFSAD